MDLHFEYFDFTPRKEFDEKANQILNDLRTTIPFDCECEARCTYFANKFFFQITFHNEDITLSAQSILDPKKENIKIRGWQVKAIDNMSLILKEQLEKLKFTSETLKSVS
jgi:hypothetical protein